MTWGKGLFLVAVYLIIVTSGCPLWAKKPKGLSDKEVQTILTDAQKSLTDLLEKTQSHQLLSPEESNVLASLHFQLLDIMALPKPPPELGKVLYQAALVHERREQFNDAYELYSYLTTHYADSVYGNRAKLAVTSLKKNHAGDLQADDPIPDNKSK